MTDEPTPQAVFDELSKAPTGDYDPMDRYREFRAVFLSTEQGRRVLHELLRRCGVNRTSVRGQPIDPHRVTFLEGERSIGLWLLGTIAVEPAQRPTQANSKGET